MWDGFLCDIGQLVTFMKAPAAPVRPGPVVWGSLGCASTSGTSILPEWLPPSLSGHAEFHPKPAGLEEMLQQGVVHQASPKGVYYHGRLPGAQLPVAGTPR
ncbi:hypothetical protein J6590_091438 [Homalodisca vitripennis]|nr:hypothetical protein J6590_091438 [Homalodisca vitripennis]